MHQAHTPALLPHAKQYHGNREMPVWQPPDEQWMRAEASSCQQDYWHRLHFSEQLTLILQDAILKVWTGICYFIISYHIITCPHRHHQRQRGDLQAGEIQDAASALSLHFNSHFYSLYTARNCTPSYAIQTKPFLFPRKRKQGSLWIVLLPFLTLTIIDNPLVPKLGNLISSEADPQTTLKQDSFPLQLHTDANICSCLLQLPVTSD